MDILSQSNIIQIILIFVANISSVAAGVSIFAFVSSFGENFLTRYLDRSVGLFATLMLPIRVFMNSKIGLENSKIWYWLIIVELAIMEFTSLNFSKMQFVQSSIGISKSFRVNRFNIVLSALKVCFIKHPWIAIFIFLKVIFDAYIQVLLGIDKSALQVFNFNKQLTILVVSIVIIFTIRRYKICSYQKSMDIKRDMEIYSFYL